MHDLYCCLLPRCEALRTCRLGFSIASIVIYCFFTAGSVKFLQLSFMIVGGEELTELGFVREECEKNS